MTSGRQPTTNTDNKHLCTLNVNLSIVKVAVTAPGHSQKRDLSPGSAGCYVQRIQKLKYVKGVSCVTQLSCVKPVTNVQDVTSNLPVGVRLQNYWQTWLDLGAGPKVNPERGVHAPLSDPSKTHKVSHSRSCYVNPHRNLYLQAALHQLIDKNAVELVQNQSSLGFSTDYF